MIRTAESVVFTCCPPAPDDTPMPELQGFKVRSEQVEMELSHLTETLHVFRANDLEIWESITFQPNDNILTFSREKDSQGYYRLGQSLTGIKLKEQLRGRTTPSTEDECQAIQEHLPQELTEGAVIRVYSKDEGNGDHFGDYTSQFALDLFVAQVPGFEEPQPVAASGWILQTQSDGTQVFWETNLTFQLDASAHVQSRLIWGTGRFEGVTGEVSGVSVPEDPNNPLESVFLYDDSGWIRFASESETSIAE